MSLQLLPCGASGSVVTVWLWASPAEVTDIPPRKSRNSGVCMYITKTTPHFVLSQYWAFLLIQGNQLVTEKADWPEHFLLNHPGRFCPFVRILNKPSSTTSSPFLWLTFLLPAFRPPSSSPLLHPAHPWDEAVTQLWCTGPPSTGLDGCGFCSPVLTPPVDRTMGAFEFILPSLLKAPKQHIPGGPRAPGVPYTPRGIPPTHLVSFLLRLLFLGLACELLWRLVSGEC